MANTIIDGTLGVIFPDGSVQGKSGYGPAFSAYNSSVGSATTSAFTKAPCNVEEFDTASAYDNITNYRFQPLVAGYYQINGQVSFTGASITRAFTQIYKTGSAYKLGSDVSTTRAVVSSIVYLNGSTDYVELFYYVTGTSVTFNTGNLTDNYFNGIFIRGA